MKASISGHNGSSRLALSLPPTEMAFLTGGLDSRTGYRLNVEGDVASGLRITAGEGPLTPKLSGDHLWVDMPTNNVQAAHEPVCQADLLVKLDRDEGGPFIFTQPLPAPFVPSPKRRTAKANMERFERENAQNIAAQFFRSDVTVKTPSSVPIPWTFDKTVEGDGIARHHAKVRCSSCANTAEINMKAILSSEMIKKKFLQKGWWIKNTKATCPACQRPEHVAPKPAADMEAVIDAATRNLTAGSKIAQLKAAMATVNQLIEDIADPKICLRVVKNRLSAYKMCEITEH